MIPKGLTKQYILKAIRKIDKEGIPKIRKSFQYDLIINGKPYPPKLVISWAYLCATGKEWPYKKFDAIEAKNFFISNNYIVRFKNSKMEL